MTLVPVRERIEKEEMEKTEEKGWS